MDRNSYAPVKTPHRVVNQMQTFIKTLFLMGVFLICTGVFFVIGPVMEAKYMPVTDDVRVDFIKIEDNTMYFHAYGNKRRQCSLLDVRVLVTDGKKVPTKGAIWVVNDGIGARTRPEGMQDLGVWAIRPSGTKLEVEASYHCHSLWITNTKLGSWKQ